VKSDLSDATLILLGHGTTLNVDSSAPVYQHAGELRRKKVFAEVREAFWKQEPSVVDLIGKAATDRVFVVPLFISEGYFSEDVIPRALGFRKPGEVEWGRSIRHENQTFFYCKPIGTHERMTEVLLARAREIVERFPFPRAPKAGDTTLFIAGHGTEQNENSRKVIEKQVELIRQLNVYSAVHAVFLEEEPRIASCYQLAETRNIVMVPFFISDGLHAQEDIPILLGETERNVRQRLQQGHPTWRNPTEKKGKLVWYSRSVGSEPLLAEVILERVREAATSG